VVIFSYLLEKEPFSHRSVFFFLDKIEKLSRRICGETAIPNIGLKRISAIRMTRCT